MRDAGLDRIGEEFWMGSAPDNTLHLLATHRDGRWAKDWALDVFKITEHLSTKILAHKDHVAILYDKSQINSISLVNGKVFFKQGKTWKAPSFYMSRFCGTHQLYDRRSNTCRKCAPKSATYNY